jgi:hypothetical protein
MSTINGLPAHVLLVHAVVMFVPVSALLLLLSAWWPAARRRLGLVTGIVAGITLILVPITTDAGDWLEHHLPRTPLLRVHTELGDTMLPWAVGLFVIAAAVSAREFLRTRRAAGVSTMGGPGAATGTALAERPTDSDSHGIGGRTVTIALAVLALIVAVGSTVTVYRIGDSGARAAWTGNFSPTPIPSQHQKTTAGD